MMAGSTPIPLVVPIPIQLGDPIFSAICAWPFPDAFVSRLLRDDIPQRIKFGRARMWAYLGPARDIVGFGSIDVCTDYGALTRNKPHPHIPLLAVNPENQGSGYGKSIVRHLIDEASLLACQPGNLCHDFLFLEVYASSLKAIGLYEKCGFTKLRERPEFDPIEQKSYFIMTKRVSIASQPQTKPRP